MELILPTTEYKTSFIEMVKEFQTNDDYSYTHRTKLYKQLSVPDLEKDFDAFVAGELNAMGEANVPEGRVPYTRYWLVDNGQFIGSVDIRHRLNEALMSDGGHMGYDIRPSMRGKGYGNTILALALGKARQIGIARALLTVDIRNEVSRKIIEKNGGVLENQIPNPERGFDTLRFWIENK